MKVINPPRSKTVIFRGEDTCGKFILTAAECFHCGKLGPCVKYAPKSFSVANFNIASLDYTILRDTKNRLGITCGCYARFHRQIAHIYEKTLKRPIATSTSPIGDA